MCRCCNSSSRDFGMWRFAVAGVPYHVFRQGWALGFPVVCLPEISHPIRPMAGAASNPTWGKMCWPNISIRRDSGQKQGKIAAKGTGPRQRIRGSFFQGDGHHSWAAQTQPGVLRFTRCNTPDAPESKPKETGRSALCPHRRLLARGAKLDRPPFAGAEYDDQSQPIQLL